MHSDGYIFLPALQFLRNCGNSARVLMKILDFFLVGPFRKKTSPTNFPDAGISVNIVNLLKMEVR